MGTTVTQNYNWVNEHNSIKKTVLKRYEISNDAGAANWKTGFAGIQQMLLEAKAANERVRSYGGRWSLSEVAICSDVAHNSKPLTFYAPIGKSLIVGQPFFPSAIPLEQRLFFVQCGAQIMQLNRALEDKGLCLPTTGASNGQTIAGAISTGTHGSAMHIGSMPDYVRAIHLVTSDKDHYLLQPKTNTALNNGFATALGATEIIDDDLFYSALVSFGAFGIIHGYVIETMPLYMLDTTCQRRDFSEVAPILPLMAAFDPADTTPITDFLKQFNIISPNGGELHQVDLTINPYAATNNCFLRAMFKLPYDGTKLSQMDLNGTRVGNDVLSVIGKLANVAGNLVPTIVSGVFGSAQPVQNNFIQTPRNTFGDSTIYQNQQGGTSMELGVAVADAEKALKITIDEMKHSLFPGVIGVRFVKPTKATVGFTKFSPLTCTIEIPSINIDSTKAGYQSVFDALDDADIPFTLHWGQVGDYSPYRLQKMYGASLGKWIKARETLLPDSTQRYMFTNDFMKGCGLGEAMPLVSGAPIV
jgi:hypothetical protein